MLTVKITNDFRYRDEVISLYIKTFTSGDSKQYIDLELLNDYMDTVLNQGYAVIALSEDQITGALLCLPLKFDKDLPASISNQYDVENCIYIAELMVDEKHRGEGIGEKLMIDFQKEMNQDKFHDIFIRVWDQNTLALRLYQKMGFVPVAEITQNKIMPDGLTTFVMNKIYLHKKSR